MWCAFVLIPPLSRHFVDPRFAAVTAASRLEYVSTSFGETFCPVKLSHSCPCNIFSIGFMFGLWLGYFNLWPNPKFFGASNWFSSKFPCILIHSSSYKLRPDSLPPLKGGGRGGSIRLPTAWCCHCCFTVRMVCSGWYPELVFLCKQLKSLFLVSFYRNTFVCCIV